MKEITIYAVDDHSLVIAGIKNLLNDVNHIHITGVFTSGNELINALQKGTPDVLLLDILLPDIHGKDLASIIKQQYPEIKIIALTSLDAPSHVKAMMKNGCDGYLLKNTDQDKLITAIETVNLGGNYIEPYLEKQMLHSFLNFKEKNKQEAIKMKNIKLTKREKEILSLIIKENNNQEIADILHLSIRTVEFHRLNLQQKLNVKTAMGLLKSAIEMGLI